jgi:hypothetical protein
MLLFCNQRRDWLNKYLLRATELVKFIAAATDIYSSSTEGGLSRASSVIAPIKSLLAIIAPEQSDDCETWKFKPGQKLPLLILCIRISSTYFLKMNSNMTQIPLVFGSKLKRGTKLLKTYILLRQQSQVFQK